MFEVRGTPFVIAPDGRIHQAPKRRFQCPYASAKSAAQRLWVGATSPHPSRRNDRLPQGQTAVIGRHLMVRQGLETAPPQPPADPFQHQPVLEDPAGQGDPRESLRPIRRVGPRALPRHAAA